MTCSSGATSLYKYPAARDVVNATDPVNFQWDTTCKVGNVEKIDLYLYMPSAQNALLHAWSGIPFADGQYAAQLSPYWWNLSTTADLYVNIMKHQGQVWENTWSRGPSFSVIWEPSMTSTLSLPTGTGVVQSVDGNVSGKKVSKGVIAVAVIIPIVVIAILGGIAFYFFRIREKEKLKRWSQALSQHSAMEWEKGALPGERLSAYGRPSSGYQRSRPSTGYGRPSTSYGRPASSVMLDNMAGAGAYGTARFPNSTENLDSDGNIRSSVVMPDGYVRQSRISFADQARPRLSSSDGASRPHISSGLHTAAVYNSGSAIDDTEVSPTQIDGPSPFGDSEMLTAQQDHIGLQDRKLSPAGKAVPLPTAPPVAAVRNDSDDLRGMPALHYATSADDFSALPPTMSEMDASRSLSPDAGSSAHGHTVQYGPDQMLAVYAARGKASSPEPSASVASPPPVAKSGIRRLLTRKESGRASGRATPTGRQTPSGRQTPAPDPRGESPEPVSMRSYVHLNNGTASSQVVDALPPPGPPGRSQSQQGHSQHGHSQHGHD